MKVTAEQKLTIHNKITVGFLSVLKNIKKKSNQMRKDFE